jgi:hypothetical protein
VRSSVDVIVWGPFGDGTSRETVHLNLQALPTLPNA